MTTLGIDWGSYLGPSGEINLPWPDLIEKAGVQFAIFKGAQEDASMNISAMKNITAARDYGLVVGSYYWNDPGLSAQYQIDTYSKAIDYEKPDFIAVDIEQYIVNGEVKDPYRISENARCVCQGLQARYPEKKVVPYTSYNFVVAHSPHMAQWLPLYTGREWVASWPDYGMSPYRETWDQISDGMFMHPVAGWQNIHDYKPTLPPGWSTWKLWQYSSRILLPPEMAGTIYDHQYDWNLFSGSIDDLKAWCGFGPQPPSLEKRVTDLEIWARTLGYTG